MRHILFSIRGECPGSHKHSFFRPLAMKSTHEFLYFRPPHSAVPALRLKVNHIQAEPVFIDDSINPLIPTAAERFSSITSGSPIAHVDEQLHYKPLEKFWGRLLDTFEEFSCQLVADSLICSL